MFRYTLIIAVLFSLTQLQAGDPLKVVREKGFYKTGEAAKNKSFVEWLKKPVFGEESAGVIKGQNGKNDGNASASKSGSGFLGGLFGSRPIKRNAALETIRDEGYKEKEARMRAEWEAKQRAERAAEMKKEAGN